MQVLIHGGMNDVGSGWDPEVTFTRGLLRMYNVRVHVCVCVISFVWAMRWQLCPMLHVH